MNKHTPGPWTADQAGRYWLIHAGNMNAYSVCEVNPIEGVTPHNAHLISAAPDLLKALEEAVSKGCLSGAMLNDARAAIHKARGEA